MSEVTFRGKFKVVTLPEVSREGDIGFVAMQEIINHGIFTLNDKFSLDVLSIKREMETHLFGWSTQTFRLMGKAFSRVDGKTFRENVLYEQVLIVYQF